MKEKFINYYGLKKIKKVDIIFVLACILIITILFFLSTGFEGAVEKKGSPVKAKIIEVDNSRIQQIGLIKTGFQNLKIIILNGKYKNQTVETINNFLGKLELDKYYFAGEIVYTILETVNNKIIYANVMDRYRLNIELFLFSAFALLLILFAGWTGFKALVSFVFTLLVIWKIMLPGFLKNYNPVLLSYILVVVFVFAIVFLVAGFTRKGLTAFMGAFSGITICATLAVIYGYFFKISGAIKPFSELLIYTGFPKLDLSGIFISGIFISSSGVLIDVAMDVSASQNEIIIKKPDIKTGELILSGFSVGQAVIGTMATTLLIAYSGGYTTVLMVFIAQGIPVLNILNLQYISAEILHTLVGSFGFVCVAPLTAIIGGIIYTGHNKKMIHS